MHISNEKATAWELIGDQFWTVGRVAARPSPQEQDLFLKGISPGDRVCVVGASTKFLIEEAADRGAKVTVIDFSKRMCSDLKQSLSRNDIEIRLADLTQTIGEDLAGSFDFVLNDRLINRFSAEEAIRAVIGMLELAGSGCVRASVKLGFYDMDLRLIEFGKKAGNLEDFFSPSDKTFHFVKAGNVLDQALVAHGNIDRETLLEWYRRRGKETRFEDSDVRRLLSNPALKANGEIQISSSIAFPDAPNTRLYEFSSVNL